MSHDKKEEAQSGAGGLVAVLAAAKAGKVLSAFTVNHAAQQINQGGPPGRNAALAAAGMGFLGVMMAVTAQHLKHNTTVQAFLKEHFHSQAQGPKP